MSMIDHDDIDALRARSRAQEDARRYRHVKTGIVYRVRTMARSLNGPCELYPASGADGHALLHTTNDRLTVDFTRCDVGAPPAPLRIPTPAEILPKAIDHTIRIAECTALVVEQLRASQGAGATITEHREVVIAVSNALRAAGWQTRSDPARDAESATLHVTAPSPIDPRSFG